MKYQSMEYQRARSTKGHGVPEYGAPNGTEYRRERRSTKDQGLGAGLAVFGKNVRHIHAARTLERMSTEYPTGGARSTQKDEHGVPNRISTEYLTG